MTCILQNYRYVCTHTYISQNLGEIFIWIGGNFGSKMIFCTSIFKFYRKNWDWISRFHSPKCESVLENWTFLKQLFKTAYQKESGIQYKKSLENVFMPTQCYEETWWSSCWKDKKLGEFLFNLTFNSNL